MLGAVSQQLINNEYKMHFWSHQKLFRYVINKKAVADPIKICHCYSRKTERHMQKKWLISEEKENR